MTNTIKISALALLFSTICNAGEVSTNGNDYIAPDDQQRLAQPVQSGTNINNSARGTGKRLGVTTIANGAASGTFGLLSKHYFATAACPAGPHCAPYTTLGTTFLGMAVQTGMQALSQGGNYRDARNTEAASQCGNDPSCYANFQNGGGEFPPFPTQSSGSSDPTYTNPSARAQNMNSQLNNGTNTKSVAGRSRNALDSLVSKTESDARQLIEDAKKKGVSFDPKTNELKLPQGTINGNSLATAAGMAAAGFTPEQIAAIEDAKQKANAAALKKIEELEGMGLSDDVGAAQRLRMANDGLNFDPNAYLAKMMKDANGKAGIERGVAGLTRQVGDENIGVAGDNIFQMVNRRYQAKQQEGVFIQQNAK